MLNEAIVHFLPDQYQKWIDRAEKTMPMNSWKIFCPMKSPADLLMMLSSWWVCCRPLAKSFFSGVFCRNFLSRFSNQPGPELFLPAFLFSAISYAVYGISARMALGIILGALYWYSGSLYTSMLGHFIFNTINIFLDLFQSCGPGFESQLQFAGFSAVGSGFHGRGGYSC